MNRGERRGARRKSKRSCSPPRPSATSVVQCSCLFLSFFTEFRSVWRPAPSLLPLAARLDALALGVVFRVVLPAAALELGALFGREDRVRVPARLDLQRVER